MLQNRLPTCLSGGDLRCIDISKLNFMFECFHFLFGILTLPIEATAQIAVLTAPRRIIAFQLALLTTRGGHGHKILLPPIVVL
jgi:hypothetical protein